MLFHGAKRCVWALSRFERDFTRLNSRHHHLYPHHLNYKSRGSHYDVDGNLQKTNHFVHKHGFQGQRFLHQSRAESLGMKTSLRLVWILRMFIRDYCALLWIILRQRCRPFPKIHTQSGMKEERSGAGADFCVIVKMMPYTFPW